ncbi:MAG: peroxidase-related enzyme [Bacteroidota bacterium]
MPFIPLEGHLPGITGLLEYSKSTAQPIRDLTQFLLRGPSTLTQNERELIATVVSSGNECTFCTTAHAAAADLLAGENSTSQQVRTDIESSDVSPKLKALLQIAAATRKSGKEVSDEHIQRARKEGATDIEIHDTVLIAALFCLYNRYVDGLGTSLPSDAGYYNVLADRLVNHGYTRLPQGYEHLKK